MSKTATIEAEIAALREEHGALEARYKAELAEVDARLDATRARRTLTVTACWDSPEQRGCPHAEFDGQSWPELWGKPYCQHPAFDTPRLVQINAMPAWCPLPIGGR